MASGKYSDAELLYRKSIAKDPKFAEGYYRLGLLEYQLRHGAEALDNLQRAVDFDPNNDIYGVLLASVSIEAYQALPSRKNLYEEAAHEADLLLKKDPNSFDGLRLKGDVLVIDRNYDEALSDFRKARAIKPDDPNVILAMAQVLFAQNHDREGEALVQQFLNVHKDFLPVYDLLETHFVRTKQFADAERLLQSEIAAFPKDARPRLQLAALYRASGRDQDMSRELQKIVSDRTTFSAGPALVGDFYADAGKWDEALAQFRVGVRTASDTEKVRYHKRIERALEAQGKRQEALGELNEILKSNPKDADMRLSRAILMRQSQDPKDRDSAIEEFKALAAQYPQNAVVHYNLGLSYWGKGDSGDAWQELRKSADLRKSFIPPRLLLADIAQTAHNYSAALESANQVLAVDPNNVDAKLLRASALVGDKSYRQAEIELKALSQLQPNSKEVGLQLAALATAQKDYAKAEGVYRNLYRPGSTDLRPLQGLLNTYMLEHHPEKAHTLLEDALKQEPDSRPVRLLLASVATQEGKFDVASQQYRWLQAQDPKFVQAYSALGDLYQREGDPQGALASYEKAEELSPNDTKLLNTIAILESNTGQSRQAIATLNKQLALDPNNAAAMNNLAFNLAETGTDLDRAATLVQEVARRFPTDPGVIDTLGWVYAKRGLNESAMQVFRGLVKKYPNEPTFHYHLAVVLLQNKQPSDAKREFLAALSQHPPKDLSSKIQENLAQIH